MMAVAHGERYGLYRSTTNARPETEMAILLFGAVGAIAWAIRGTGGWGGIDGTLVPGMAWAVLWYYLCERRGIDARSIPLWLGLGIALGGELGYGQYVSWIRGEFRVGEGTVPVAPWVGYAWFVFAGIGWGAPGGVALGWALSGRSTPRRWALRIGVPAAAAFGGWVLVSACPWLFFPNYGLGIYAAGLDPHLQRTVYTNTQNFVVVAWWLGVVLVAVLQRDRPTLVMCLLIGGGFGLGFMLAALWCLGYVYAPRYIDWWKVWELNAGFYLGALYALAFHASARHLEEAPRRKVHHGERFASIASALGVFFILTLTFLEDAPWTGVLLGLFYAVPVIVVANDPERRHRLSRAYTMFLLLFIALRGLTMNLGGVLGLYDPEVVGQYSWPTARIALFAPPAAVLVSVTLYRMGRIVKDPPIRSRLCHAHVADVITGLAFVGAATIWPAKIAVLYALFLFLAIFAFNRIDRCTVRAATLE